jgi:hypothetical protein
VCEALLALIFTAGFFHQATLASDTLQRAVADTKLELADGMASAETVKSFEKLDKLGFQRCQGLLVRMMSGTEVLEQAGRAMCWKRRSNLRTVARWYWVDQK